MLYDLTIVGAGPAGLYAAFYAGLRDLKTKVLEADVEVGGRLRYYPEKIVWDVGGLRPTQGDVLRANLDAQARTFHPEVLTGRTVVALDPVEKGWSLLDALGDRHLSRTVLLTVGYGTLGTRRLDVPGSKRWEGSHVHYSLKDPRPWEGKRVIVSGGGNSSVEWALQLAETSVRVTLVHRRPGFRAHEATVRRLEQAGVEVMVPWRIAALEATGQELRHLWLEETLSGLSVRREADAVLVGHGMEFSAGSDVMSAAGQPGVFCAGDCVPREGKAHLIASTFPEAIEAVNAAKRFLDPEAEAQAMVSSHHPKFAL